MHEPNDVDPIDKFPNEDSMPKDPKEEDIIVSGCTFFVGITSVTTFFSCRTAL
jgi:hypothetical protein